MQKYKLHRRLITIPCDNCGELYQKPISEYTRNCKLNRHSFCCRSCSVIYGNLVKPPQFRPNRKYAQLKEYNTHRPKDPNTPFRYVLRAARQRFKEFNITIEDLKEIWYKQQGICPYSGVNLQMRTYTKGFKCNDIYAASLDRIDSSKGYVVGNIQFVSKAMNYCKNTLSDSEMKELIKIISTNYNNSHISI